MSARDDWAKRIDPRELKRAREKYPQCTFLADGACFETAMFVRLLHVLEANFIALRDDAEEHLVEGLSLLCRKSCNAE